MADIKSDFLKRYQPIHDGFVRFCRSRSFGVMDTEDLVQESVLATLEAMHKKRSVTHLLGFMLGVASNIVRNKKRRFKYRAAWDEQLMQELAAKTTSPEIAADIHFLMKAMDRLPERQKEAIELFEISGFSIREISEIQESTENATKTRISRARRALRKLLEDAPKRSVSYSNAMATYVSILL